jgi:hypothetical protein
MEKKWAFQILSGDGDAMLISLSLLLASHTAAVVCLAFCSACVRGVETDEKRRYVLSWFRNGMQVIRWRRK